MAIYCSAFCESMNEEELASTPGFQWPGSAYKNNAQVQLLLNFQTLEPCTKTTKIVYISGFVLQCHNFFLDIKMCCWLASCSFIPNNKWGVEIHSWCREGYGALSPLWYVYEFAVTSKWCADIKYQSN